MGRRLRLEAHLEVDELERRSWCVSTLCVLLVAVTACSSGTTTTACRRVSNTSPGTAHPGQVDVATDHSVYAPGDTMQITLTSHLDLLLFFHGDYGACPFFGITDVSAGADASVDTCPPYRGEAAPPVPDQTYLRPGTSVRVQLQIPTPVTPGTYRLGADYLSYGPDGRPPNGATQPGRGTIFSASVRICACAVCA